MLSKVGEVMKRVFWGKVWAPKCGKVDFFQKLGLALGLGLRLGLAIQGVKTSTFDEPDSVQGWESDE